MEIEWLKRGVDLGAFALVAWLFVWTFRNTLPQQQAGFLQALERQRGDFSAQLERQERDFTAVLHSLKEEMSRERAAFETRMDGMSRAMDRLTLAVLMHTRGGHGDGNAEVLAAMREEMDRQSERQGARSERERARNERAAARPERSG